MESTHHINQMREAFVAESRFIETGGVVTDLDGIAVHEFEDRIIVPEPVVEGLNTLSRTVGCVLVQNRGSCDRRTSNC